MAASAEPMAKVMEMVALTLMPISSAAPLSSDTARMALPILVLPVNSVSAIMMTMLARTVVNASLVMTSLPPNRRRLPKFTTEAKLLGLEPQISSAMFCRK